jgi:hypothetical protein
VVLTSGIPWSKLVGVELWPSGGPVADGTGTGGAGGTAAGASGASTSFASPPGP